MIKDEEYKVKFYTDNKTGKSHVLDYIEGLSIKESTKIHKYIEFLRKSDGVLDEPYSRHIKEKIRELRVDFSNKKHRIFYFTFVSKNIILLHVFLKKTSKTPVKEIIIAEKNYIDVINNKKLYE
jgi:phage-related protein